ncbi:MAG: helix-turn-helix domain-containing protein [Myxococcales bacterium]|nr:helix-turn-helix domain-containing protein [Myxococcales bacterium]
MGEREAEKKQSLEQLQALLKRSSVNMRRLRRLDPQRIALGMLAKPEVVDDVVPSDADPDCSRQLVKSLTAAAEAGDALLTAEARATAVAEEHELLTADQVARETGLSRGAAYELIKRLDGHVRIGRSLRVPRRVVEDYVARGGDACRTKQTSIAGAKSGGAGSRTGRAPESAKARTRRINDWHEKLLDSSSSRPSKSRKDRRRKSR